MSRGCKGRNERKKNYEITITTTAVSPRGEAKEWGGERIRRRAGKVGVVLEKMAREKDVKIMRDKMSERKDSLNIIGSRIKVNQLHLQIAYAWPWPALPSLWGSLLPDYMKLG